MVASNNTIMVQAALDAHAEDASLEAGDGRLRGIVFIEFK
jgi:hypothetical protein